MKVLTCFLAALLCRSAVGQTINGIPLGGLTPNPAGVAAAEAIVETNGCNANVCFALDGSGSVGATSFISERTFAAITASIMAGSSSVPPPQFAATQYGLINQDISPLTDDAAAFAIAANSAQYMGASFTFLSAGIGFCINQLNDPPVADDVNKIVVIGDGKANFGDLTGPLSPKSIVETWKAENAPNNNACAVAVGFDNGPGDKAALADIVGGMENVLEVSDFTGLLEIIEDLVAAICIVPTPEPV